jgi:hypothetical protein
VTLAAEAADFGAATARALELGSWDEDCRKDFIAENSWSRRFDALLDLALADDQFSQDSTSGGGS